MKSNNKISFINKIKLKIIRSKVQKLLYETKMITILEKHEDVFIEKTIENFKRIDTLLARAYLLNPDKNDLVRLEKEHEVCKQALIKLENRKNEIG